MSNLTINVNNDYMLGRMNGKTLHIVMIEQQQEIERLHSIIKEVREYANTDKNCVPKHIKDYINNLLDKEKNSGKN